MYDFYLVRVSFCQLLQLTSVIIYRRDCRALDPLQSFSHLFRYDKFTLCSSACFRIFFVNLLKFLRYCHIILFHRLFSLCLIEVISHLFCLLSPHYLLYYHVYSHTTPHHITSHIFLFLESSFYVILISFSRGMLIVLSV